MSTVGLLLANLQDGVNPTANTISGLCVLYNTVSSKMKARTESTDMSFLRRVMCISWTDKMTDEQFYTEV